MDVAVLVSHLFFEIVSLSLSFVLFLSVALDSDGLLYLKEQMEAEDDAERLLRRTEKRAFAAFKISFLVCFTVYAFQNLFLLIFLDHKSQSCNPSRFVSSSHSLATSC